MSSLITKAQLLGSKTAKDGFDNEKDIINIFNGWETDKDAHDWLADLGYLKSDIRDVIASKAPHRTKPDIAVDIFLKNGNKITCLISIKLVHNISQGFNQVDKRWVDDYTQLWGIPLNIQTSLKLFTGEITHNKLTSRDERRLFLNELDSSSQLQVIDFFEKNKHLIMCDLFEGRIIKANWMMVTAKDSGKIYWKIRSMSQAISLFSAGQVSITAQGSLKIGNVTMQRKGGDNGRPTANMLQFKANPLLLF